MKKILLISYFFPPSVDQRSLKFAKYLPQYGWLPWVLSPKHSEYRRFDSTLLKEIPPNCKVIDTPSSEKVPRPIIHPNDFRSGWFTEAIIEGVRIIEEQNIDVIFTTASPNLSHLIGLTLKQMTKKPWIADFRDEWTTNPYIQGLYPGKQMNYNAKLEQLVLKQADAVVSGGEKMSDILFRLSGTSSKKKFHTIHEGFDPLDFPNKRVSKENNRFTLTYMGALYGLRKSLADRFFEEIVMAVSNRRLMPKDFELLMVGSSLTLPVKKRIFQIRNAGYMNHHEALERTGSADLLLLFIDPKEGAQTIPSKLFEYINLKKPIFALIPPNSEVAHIIRATRTGIVVDSNNPAEGIKTLALYLRSWKNKSLKFNPCLEEIEKYDRKLLTGKLAKVLNEI
ncbi:hypothetical protein [Candidatus Pristimantibacillus sp. PTI5]|uniref:hypothetical protein n=1 Tax=Candidatus Pristimantibacillus sp. PTI5 TaxID=3400422 RepID=UPI003B011ECD